MAYIFKNKAGDYYLIDKSFKPVKWIKLGVISAAEAKTVLAKYRTDETYLRLGLPIKATEMTFRELCDEYHEHIKHAKAPYTVDREKHFLDHFCKQTLRNETFGKTFIAHIHATDIETHFFEKKYKPYSCHNIAKSIKSAFKLAVSKKYISENPVDKVRLPKIESLPPKALDPKIVKALFAEMQNRILAYYKLLYYTGIRPGEGLRIRKVDVDLDNDRIFIMKTKTKKFRVLPIHKHLKPHISKLMKGKDDYLFAGRDGEPQQSFKMGLKRAIVDAKLTKVKGINAYAFRHTFATQVLAKTSNLRAVQMLLGHSRSTMTERYAHVLNEQLKEAVGTL